MKRYFVTGTDTDCGKTYITAQLIQQVKNAIAVKPVASGGDRGDAKALVHKDLSLDEINPWYFSLPISPHLSSKNENKHINLSELAAFCTHFEKPGYDTLFIEGAGGLQVPLNDKETWIDFLTMTQIPVIVVVGMKLGCINHTLLTQTALKAHGLKCMGWIANCMNPEMLFLQENIKTIENLMQSPLLGIAPYNSDLELFCLL